MSIERYQTIVQHLQTDEHTLAAAVPGLCRIWTREAIKILKHYQEIFGLSLLLQAREVELEPGLTHTYLRLVLDHEEAWTLDGTGTLSFQPYFGPEKNSPFNIDASTFDPIHYYEINPSDYRPN